MGKRELRNTRMARMGKILVLTADQRRWTQTFSSADLAVAIDNFQPYA
jgi:hypothetical protein